MDPELDRARDDTDEGWGDRPARDRDGGGDVDPDLERLLAERPPHHDRSD